jgi:iron(III) transport system permease protein
LALLGTTNASALLARSLFRSAAVTALALALGIPLGVLVGRTNVRSSRVAGLIHSFPMFLPPFVVSLGWFHLFGANGLAGSPTTSARLFSETGLVLVLALTFAPIVTALTALGLQSLDPSLEEAARVVAKPLRVISRILLPAARPAWVLAAIIVFALAFSELGVPMFLRVDSFPAAVFSRLGGVDYAPGEALALVLPLVPVALVLLLIERRFVGSRSYAVLGLRSRRQDCLPLGRWRTVATLGLWSAAVVSAGPLLALGWQAVASGGFAQVGSRLGSAPWHSLSSSALAATLIVAVGLIVGHAAARGRSTAQALDAVAVLAFLAPAAVLGVALIGLWNRPYFRSIYGSAAILVVGFVARYAVIGVRTIGTLIAQTQVHVEEAAAAAGAGFWRRLTRIVLPLHGRGLALAWLLALVFCLRDLELTVLYYPPGGQTLTVRLFTLEANAPEPVVASLAVVQLAMTAAALGLGGALLKRGAA